MVIATPFASGFDHFLIADEVQFKFDRCLRFLQEIVSLAVEHYNFVDISCKYSSIQYHFTGNRASNIWCWSFFGICNPPSNRYQLPTFFSLIVYLCSLWQLILVCKSLSGSRYAIQRSGNVLMAFNNKVVTLHGFT